MFIIFNNDGSIKTLIVDRSINQGSNNVDKIYTAIDGLNNEDFTCAAEFELPNGDLVELSGVATPFLIDQESYYGYLVELSSNVTVYAGNLKLNLKLIDLQSNILCTYQATLKVNKTGYEPNETMITEAQYNSLLQSLNSFQIKGSINNIRFYPTMQSLEDDLSNLGVGQLAVVYDDGNLYFYRVNASQELEQTTVDTYTREQIDAFLNKKLNFGWEIIKTYPFSALVALFGYAFSFYYNEQDLKGFYTCSIVQQTNGFLIKINSDSGKYYSRVVANLNSTLEDVINNTYKHEFVTLDGTQTISGEKHFTENPNTNNTAFDENDFVTKKYVDDAAAGVGLDLGTEITNRENGDAYLQGQIDTINGKIPSQASSSNQLADKDFVNSTINSLAAFYITSNAQGDAFESVAQLQSATVFYSGGQVRVPTRNDYCIVRVDENHDNATTRYIYQNSQWEYQFTVNETPLTAAQLAAVNSGITALLTGQITKNKQNTANDYNSASTYQKDDLCLYNGELYRATQNIDTPEAFNSSHWERTTLAEGKVDIGTLNDYQSKFSAAPIVITADGWTQAVGGGYKKTITGQYSALGVVNNNDLVNLCAGGNTTSDIEYYGTLINQYGIQVLNVSTDSESGDTSIYLYARYQPQESINAFIGVLHYTYNPTENTALDISAIDNDTLELVNSYLKIKFGSIAQNNGKAVTGGDVYTALEGKVGIDTTNYSISTQVNESLRNSMMANKIVIINSDFYYPRKKQTSTSLYYENVKIISDNVVITSLEVQIGSDQATFTTKYIDVNNLLVSDSTNYTVTSGLAISDSLYESIQNYKVVTMNGKYYYPVEYNNSSSSFYYQTCYKSGSNNVVSIIEITVGTKVATITEKEIKDHYIHKISFSVSSKPYEIVIVSDRNSNYGDIATIISNKSGIVSLSNLMLYNLGGTWGLYNCFANSILDANIDSGSWDETTTVL